ncbi:MAG TPA: metallophosphoesterase [Silvibacterium sp.]|nr:metallophosphoesterase [Silvibacterium sp.]
MKLRLVISSWLLLASMVWPAALAQTPPATGRALLISDIHFDPLADPAIVRQLIASPVEQWDAIFQSAHQKSLSPYGADTNYALFSSTLTETAAQAPFDYVIFAGDALRHNFSQAFLTAGGKSSEFPAFAARTEAFVIQDLQSKLRVPVLAALGNNDSGCGDYQIPPDSPFLAATADQLTVLATSAEAKSTFKLGGFYSIAHPTVANQDVIVLNSIFWSASYKSCTPNTGDPGEAELAWLSWKLYTARLLHRRVTLVMHIPPGMDAYNSSRAQCKNPVSFWQAKYSTEFGALMNAYSDVVQLAFAGHIHMDDFRVTVAGAPSLPLRITPAVSPIFKNNPAFSVMTYNPKTASVSDIATFFITLSSPAPSWTEEYQFDRAYGVTSFSAANLSNIATAIRNGGHARTTFEEYYAVSTPSPVKSSNFLYYSCAETHFTPATYSDCVCGAASLSQKHSGD